MFTHIAAQPVQQILPAISDCSEYSHQQLVWKSPDIGHFMPLLELILEQLPSHCFQGHNNEMHTHIT